MPRKKRAIADEPAAVVVPVERGPGVVIRGDSPAHVHGHTFQPGEPVYGLPAEFVAYARRKPIFEVLD